MARTVEVTQKANMSNEPKKKAAVRRATYGGLLLFLFMLLYIPSLMNWLSDGQITQDVIRNGIIENYINTSAVIIRDERLLEPSAISGRCIAEIAEGERTAAYSRIAMVVNDVSDKLLQELEEVNAKIVKARMEQAEKADFFSEDLKKLDDEIALQIRNMILYCNTGNFKEMARYRANIGKIVEKKAEIVGENSTDGYISSLLNQKKDIQKKINTNTVEIRSNMSGIVSYIIDGYESVLTPEIIESLNPETIENIIGQDNETQPQTNKVQTGSPPAKIIKGTDIYIAAVVPAEIAAEYEKGDRVSLRVNDIGLETTGYIASINASGDDKSAVVVIQMSRGVDVLSTYRVIDVDIIRSTQEGLKVPLKSLMDISGDGTTAKIMLVKYNVAVARTVNILCKDEEYAIIDTPKEGYKKSVNLYDTYIINPQNVEEGEIIDR